MRRLGMGTLRREESDRMKAIRVLLRGRGLWSRGGFMLGVLAHMKDWASRKGWERDERLACRVAAKNTVAFCGLVYHT